MISCFLTSGELSGLLNFTERFSEACDLKRKQFMNALFNVRMLITKRFDLESLNLVSDLISVKISFLIIQHEFFNHFKLVCSFNLELISCANRFSSSATFKLRVCHNLVSNRVICLYQPADFAVFA